jgi:IS5 family transposase
LGILTGHAGAVCAPRSRTTEFGYKAQVVDNEDGLVLDYDVKIGNPADTERLAPAIRRIRERLGRTPEKATSDRGYGEASVERELEELGVTTIVILRKARPDKTSSTHPTSANS